MSSTAQPSVVAGFPGTESRTVAHESAAAGVPWYIWAGVAGVTSASTGLQWDVAWHRSIGRDGFWSAPHVMVQFCGVLAAIIGIWLVYQCTFRGENRLRAASVNVFGLRAPLGIFLAGWGGFAIMTSAPFDNWWHEAYGLDVKIVSPPHSLLILGIRVVALGVFFLILAEMNRAAASGASSFSALQRLLLYLGGLTVTGQMFFLQEYTFEVGLHRRAPYVAMAIAIPVAYAMISQATRFRWAATTAAGIYMLFIVGEILIFPLIGAQPKLGPVFFPVTHLVPAKFPPLIIAPAIALDLLWQRTQRWKMWQVAIVSGMVFVAVLMAVQWPFANFLLSKASENRFFGTMYFSYNTAPTSFDRMRMFMDPEHGMGLARGVAKACLYGAVSTAAGLAFGRWMRGVQR